MLNWRTIEGTSEINGQKLLERTDYLPNYMCRRGRAYLKWAFLYNFIENVQTKIVDCRIYS